MKRIASVIPCLVFLLTASSTAAVAGSTKSQLTRPEPGAARSKAPVVPEDMEPVCAEVEGASVPWAARYPEEYQEWQDSAHGTAYMRGDRDAPGCTSCHDDPATTEIRSAASRLEGPFRCARCHGDRQLMNEHNIATDVWSSYLADYHGLTIRYYRTHDRAMWRYEAICSDCHASHAVFGARDSRSFVAPASLLRTCQQCHPGAEASFTSTTTGHFRVDRKSSVLTYYIDLIYRILIPTFVGLMTAYIGLDVVYRVRKRFLRKN